MVFGSVYEITDDLTTIRKQRMWCYFDGDTVHTRWNEKDISGSGITLSMSDVIGEGLNMAATTTGFGAIEMSCINHYSCANSKIIWVSRRVCGTSQGWFGFDQNPIGNLLQSAFIKNSTADTFYTLNSGDGTTSCTTNTCTCIDTSFHNLQVHIMCCDVDGIMDGTVEATNSTRQPTVPVAPFVLLDNLNETGTNNLRMRYVEAYNT